MEFYSHSNNGWVSCRVAGYDATNATCALVRPDGAEVMKSSAPISSVRAATTTSSGSVLRPRVETGAAMPLSTRTVVPASRPPAAKANVVGDVSIGGVTAAPDVSVGPSQPPQSQPMPQPQQPQLPHNLAQISHRSTMPPKLPAAQINGKLGDLHTCVGEHAALLGSRIGSSLLGSLRQSAATERSAWYYFPT